MPSEKRTTSLQRTMSLFLEVPLSSSTMCFVGLHSQSEADGWEAVGACPGVLSAAGGGGSVLSVLHGPCVYVGHIERNCVLSVKVLCPLASPSFPAVATHGPSLEDAVANPRVSGAGKHFGRDHRHTLQDGELHLVRVFGPLSPLPLRSSTRMKATNRQAWSWYSKSCHPLLRTLLE